MVACSDSSITLRVLRLGLDTTEQFKDFNQGPNWWQLGNAGVRFHNLLIIV